jgi:hypothetical protein
MMGEKVDTENVEQIVSKTAGTADAASKVRQTGETKKIAHKIAKLTGVNLHYDILGLR